MSLMLAVAEHPVPCDITVPTVPAVDRAARRPLLRLVGLASTTVNLMRLRTLNQPATEEVSP